MSVYVGKVRASRGQWPDDAIPVYVGRPSALGNPFSVGNDGSREIVINKYRNWLLAVCEKARHPAAELLGVPRERHQRNYNIVLLCWCSPLACHADVIREAVLAEADSTVAKNMPRIAESV